MDIDIVRDSAASDVDSAELTLASCDQPANNNGQTALQAGGRVVRFTPAQNFVGQATFTCTVSDSAGGTASVGVTVDVTGERGDDVTDCAVRAPWQGDIQRHLLLGRGLCPIDVHLPLMLALRRACRRE